MRPTAKSRPAFFAGRAFAAILLLSVAFANAAPETIDQLLHHADQIKLANNDQFQALLKQLDTQSNQLNVLERDWLDYLHAWQLGYQGDYPQALTAFDTLLAHTHDPTVRARARISLIYDQVNSAHYEDAFANVSALLDSLPEVEDRNAHFLILIASADLYSNAGQYELALHYIDQALAYDSSDHSTCIALTEKATALWQSGKLRVDDAQIRSGLDTCLRVGDPIGTLIIRLAQAQTQLDHGDAAGSLKLLLALNAEAAATHSSAFNALYCSVLARGYMLTGDLAHARQYALSTIDYANKQDYPKSVADAYKILYEIAKQQGDDKSALAYHEKYAAADKGYLNGISARALAYQIVHQQVLDKKRQIDALSEQNKLLQLQQQVGAKTAENRLLYIGLLALILGIIAMWAWRTKRSQIKFQRMARRDGLTGISNRQHFFESAQDALRYCAKNTREASVLAMDLDHFKSINDMHGHAAGDAVLKRAVEACQAQLRSIDLFGRMGGEEFAILLPDCNAATAAQRANQMREAIAGLPSTVDAFGEAVVTASFGIAATQVCGYSLPTLLAHADNALYAAKHAGRNRVSVHRAGADMEGARP